MVLLQSRKDELMSNIADRIKIAQNKDGMLRRALERIIQLYTDRSHFVYELLQNAEDAEATSIKFVQYPDRLEVMHNGKPFTAENLQGLCDIGKSDKVDNLNQIGEFGVGFKSVFGICERVMLYSEPKNFRNSNIGDAIPFAVEIIDFTSPVDIQWEPMGRFYTTRFVFPYAVGQTFSGFKTITELNKTLATKLQNLGITTLLFMKNLELIEYEICLDGKVLEGQYLLEKKVINETCSLVSALGLMDTYGAKEKTEEEISYLKFSRPIDTNSSRTVDIAFPVIVTEDGGYECQKSDSPYISVYFPTETESKLGFIVQGPYRTTPNRSSIPADDEDNIRLANETAYLLRKVILDLRDAGKFNMSFIKALPLSTHNFDNYPLFKPLYEVVKTIFMRDEVIPCRNGGYVSVNCAKIARQEKLAVLFTDELLTDLVHDGGEYRWLPTYLTETSKEYESVYRYLTSELKISVIRPEDLRGYFIANPLFLPQQTDDWIIQLYSLLENIGAAFSKVKNENNMLTADIIKTSKGKFVAAYRKTESKQYIPNVFLPSKKLKDVNMHFVDPKIYERCRHFFDDILQVQQPNEYEFFITDIRKRYSRQYVYNEKQHMEDVKHLYEYLKYDEYKDDVLRIIKGGFVIRCTDKCMRNTFVARIFVPSNQNGIQIEMYLKNIASNVFFADLELYSKYNISSDMLCVFGVQNTLLRNHEITHGMYSTGRSGRQPEWHTYGEFRWKLTMEYIKEALRYISEHPSAKDSMIKSKTIFDVLVQNESKLYGTLYIGRNLSDEDRETCELIKVLRGERGRDWNGRWLYTESLDLVSQKNISKYELSSAIYGKVKTDSIIYELLGFRKTETDEVDELKKIVPKKQLDAFFEDELRRRYGITSADLSARFGEVRTGSTVSVSDETEYSFPTAIIKSWDALRKHVAEMLCYADPVRYNYVVRCIRVSNHSKESRAYLRNMYRYDNLYKYACQMCHDSCSDVEAVQIFNNPETELDPMNICLCPNCAMVYRKIRGNATEMDTFKRKILSLKESEIIGYDHVALDIGNHELWFTQIHIAEIQALLQLADDVKQKIVLHSVVESEEESNKNDLCVYSACKGKYLKRKDGFVGEVLDVNDKYLLVKIVKGDRTGQTISIQLAFIAEHPDVYQIDDV